MCQGPLCPTLSHKVQKELSQMANRNLSCAMLKICSLQLSARSNRTRCKWDPVQFDSSTNKTAVSSFVTKHNLFTRMDKEHVLRSWNV